MFVIFFVPVPFRPFLYISSILLTIRDGVIGRGLRLNAEIDSFSLGLTLSQASTWERQTESIYNHRDNSFSLTRPATPERIWHLKELSSKSNSYLSGYWHRRDGVQQGNCRGENESGISRREYIAGKGEMIYQQQWKDREQDAGTSFLKSTTLPLGGL